MQGSEAATATDKVGIGEKIAYGLGNFGTQMIFNPATSFMVFFYTDIAGIAAATVGNLLFVSRLFDLLNPLMGMVVDKTKSRHGKARPWLLWLAIPFGLSGVLLFFYPTPRTDRKNYLRFRYVQPGLYCYLYRDRCPLFGAAPSDYARPTSENPAERFAHGNGELRDDFVLRRDASLGESLRGRGHRMATSILDIWSRRVFTAAHLFLCHARKSHIGNGSTESIRAG